MTTTQLGRPPKSYIAGPLPAPLTRTPTESMFCHQCLANRYSRILDFEGDGFCIMCGRPWEKEREL